jgi:glutathione S-transferase
LICEFLNHRAGGTLFPPPGEPRWTALLIQGIADGINTAAGRLFGDERRPATERANSLMRRQTEAIKAGLDHLERDARDLSPTLSDIGAVAAACACGYLDFCWPGRDWRSRRPALSGWFQGASQRLSRSSTQHHLS